MNKYYAEHCDDKKIREREKYEENPEPKKKAMNEYNLKYLAENGDEINADRRKKTEEKYINTDKADFSTTIGEMPLDTTGYEYVSSPETAVMNWHMISSDGWRFEWDLEGYLANIESEEQSKQLYAKECLDRLLHSIGVQAIDSKRQKSLGVEFYKAMGRGCPWGKSNFDDEDNGDSQDAWLLACACCGFRDYVIENAFRTYQSVDLCELDLLKLSDEEVRNHKKNLKVRIPLPINEKGDMRYFTPWECRSIYQLKRTAHNDVDDEDEWYCLHPELIRESRDDKGLLTNAKAVICNECMNSIDNDERPMRSIRKGVDFGSYLRIKGGKNREYSIEAPSLRELQIIAKVRHYYSIVKLETNSRQLKEHQQSAIKGSTILFEHNAPDVAANLLSAGDMNRNICLHLVGCHGEFDALFQKVMKSKSADVFGRSHVIYQWLKILSEVDSIYVDSQLEDYLKFKDRLSKANNILLSEALGTFDDEAVERGENMRDDVAGIRATTNIHQQASTIQNAHDDGTFAMKYCYLTNPDKTTHSSNTDSTQAYLRTAAETLHIDVSEENNEYDRAKSYRAEYPVNEFERGEYGLVGGFPHVCMLGTAYGKDICKLNEKDCLHLLMQFTAVAATCITLIFYLFDLKRRHQNIMGMSGKIRGDPKAFEALVEEFSSARFQDKLQYAVAHPDSKDAKYVLNKLMPVLKTAGKHTTFGSLERNTATGELLSMIRRFGSEFCFLTCAIDDVNNPQVFRLTFRQPNNQEFPSFVPNEFLDQMKAGEPYAIGNVQIPTNWSALAKAAVSNPVAVAFIYKRLVYNIMTILIGMKPSTTSGSNNRTVSSRRFTAKSNEDGGGVVIGNVDAYNGVHETSGRGGLHFHLCLWGGIASSVLQSCVDVEAICDEVSRTLDSMYCAEIPRTYHVKDLIEKELLYYPNSSISFAKLNRQGRCMLISPDPTEEKPEFSDHVCTTICWCNMHGHDATRHGTCHNPPKGIEGCRMDKPSNLADKTRPVELKEVTNDEDEKKNEICYIIEDDRTKISTRQEAIESLKSKDRLDPIENRRADSRLIVWEVQRRKLERLPSYNSQPTKDWLIEQLKNAMTTEITSSTLGASQSSTSVEVFEASTMDDFTDYVTDSESSSVHMDTKANDDMDTNSATIVFNEIQNDHYHQKNVNPLAGRNSQSDVDSVVTIFDKVECNIDPVLQNLHRPRQLEIDLGSNRYCSKNVNLPVHDLQRYCQTQWSCPMPNYLLKDTCVVVNPLGDGNCLYKSCLICTKDAETTCAELRAELNEYLRQHWNDKINQENEELIIDVIHNNLTNMNATVSKNVDNNDVLRKYNRLMSDATPYHCQFGTYLELYAFAHCRKTNVVVYEKYPFVDDSPKNTYKMLAVISLTCLNDDIPTIALLYDRHGQHYQALMRHELSDKGECSSVNSAKNDIDVQSNARDNDSTISGDPIILTAKLSDKGDCSSVNSAPDDIDAQSNPGDNDSMKVNSQNKFLAPSEVDRLLECLDGMSPSDLESLYNSVSEKLEKRNGYVVDYNRMLTAILGCNTNSLLLGGTEQSKGASFYLGPYVLKNKTELSESLDIVLESVEHARKYPSIAEDRNTNKRFVQYVMTRILNQLNSLQEISDTQAAGSLIGLNVGLCSEIFVVYDAQSHINFALNEKNEADGDNEYTDDNLESDSDESSASMKDFIVSDDEDLEALLADANLTLNDVSLSEDTEPIKYYDSAYGSYPLYSVDEGSRFVAICNPELYRYRGEALKDLNRLEYFSCVRVARDRPKDESPHSGKSPTYTGRKPSCQFRFGEGIEIFASHHQTMRSKSCTPKLFQSPPPHPGLRPEANDVEELDKWQRKADIFARYYLTMFRPEDKVFDNTAFEDVNKFVYYPYNYDWEEFVTFVNHLQADEGTPQQRAINQFRLDQMVKMMQSLKMNSNAKKILYHYRGRSRDMWSPEEQEEGRQEYKGDMNRTRSKNNELDEEADNLCQAKQLSSRTERDIMQKVAFTDQLLNDMDQMTSHICFDASIDDNNNSISDNRTAPQYPVETTAFDEDLAFRILEKPTLESIDRQPKQRTNTDFFNGIDSADSDTRHQRFVSFVDEKHVSADKVYTLAIIYDHFNNVLDGSAKEKESPFLLVTGAPGTGKSWLVRIIVEMAYLMTLESPIRSAWMGIAAINIGGSTICSFWDIPFVHEGSLTGTIKPWNPDRLEAFKRKYDLDRISIIILDEVSMVKPWVLAYIDARLREATQCDKPFGGKMVLMLADFDQQPPIGGSSMPHLAMVLLRKEYEDDNTQVRIKRTKREKLEMRCRLSRTGVELFKKAGLIKLDIQHRCADDAVHTALLEKMSSGASITPADLLLYNTLLTAEESLFGTIIVTSNYERHEINAHQATLWAKYYHTHVIRWRRKLNMNAWQGKPSTPRQIEEAEKETCFWEYFVPMAPAYLTYNLNTDYDLANGSEVRLHSLSFDSDEASSFLNRMQQSTAFGDTIDLPAPPKAINVELYPDYDEYSKSKKSENKEKRSQWRCGSITNDGRIVFPVDITHQNKVRWSVESIRARGGAVRFRASRGKMADYFPIELGFCITVEKAQGRTIRKVIASLSEHPIPILRFIWEQVYVILSRIKDNNDMRLLLKMNDRHTLNYIANLEKDKYTADFFHGYSNPSSSTVSYWNKDLAAKQL